MAGSSKAKPAMKKTECRRRNEKSTTAIALKLDNLLQVIRKTAKLVP